jgi:hypothetical protein
MVIHDDPPEVKETIKVSGLFAKVVVAESKQLSFFDRMKLEEEERLKKMGTETPAETAQDKESSGGYTSSEEDSDDDDSD